ncbi:hypothetical protein C7S10_07945 [Nocardioides currus]|uniref:DUF2637 domain-containing protein n=1 Tax=Nocardioides currus TaxID=2133958 RepID=A0A2R7Z019_9ACTN|nr:hypothetical protein C7S10_07945 [Nocardioides currus]
MPTVREWSESVSPRDFRLRDLDLYVLQQYDQVLRSLGWRGRYRAGATGDGPRPARRDDLVFIPLFVLPMAGMFATGSGWFTTAGGGAMEFEGFESWLGVPIVVACFALSLPGPVLVLRRWWTGNRRWTTPEVVCLALDVGFGLLALRGLANAWQVEVLSAAPASLPVWAATVVAAVSLAAIVSASRGRRDAVLTHFERVGDPDPARARDLVEALAAGEREHLITQRRRAVATLRERGLIDLDEAVHVESLPLGESAAITS